MRFLKNKIFRAQEAAKRSLLQPPHSDAISEAETDEGSTKNYDQHQAKTQRRPRSTRKGQLNTEESPKKTSLGPNSRHLASTKNIAINYGRAIASFACSLLAIPYLEPRLKEFGLVKSEFFKFLKSKKRKIQGICSLRSLLVIEKEDDVKTKDCKKLFQWLAEVFIKCFSVNWIIHGKVSHKMVYLKFRFKMLRRIQNPEQFTYIKERPKKS